MRNTNLLILLAVVVLTVTVLDTATGQYRRRRGYYGGEPVQRASTVGESHMNGMGDLARSKAESNLTNAEAMRTMSDVRSMELDNRIKYTETYWERKRINSENRFYSDDEKAAIRQRNLEKQMFHRARTAQGSRPDAGALDPVSGNIAWPLALGNPAYEQYRSELENLFAERADKQGAIGYEGFTAITKLTDSWLKKLRKDLPKSSMSQRDYTDSKRFIESLAVEARHTSA